MDRQLHKKYNPQCPRQAGLPDQYMWKEKDTTYYKCYNGISHPIYDCKGWINYSLPLEMYPRVNTVHPQISMVNRMHMNLREDPNVFVREEFSHEDRNLARTEGFYYDVLPKAGMHLSSDMKPGYPLPSPYGDTRGCSACNGCV
uniref:Uncharacterized protein n=1 Tax=Marseillevirus LCMAC102 TaxID=2506603 RepID=A0A481YVU7_9VIRU|nr:MAG: hypothetical protein LCMAC102_04220 [Marseillevirus LCMAC102]